MHEKSYQRETKPSFMPLIRLLFRDMVETVAWLHKHEICHMDISLENTVLQKKKNKNDNIPNAKIMDFGLSIDFKKVRPSNLLKKWQWNDIRGKYKYMPPKVYKQEIYDCRLADIWCLGVCLYKVCLSFFFSPCLSLSVCVCVCVFFLLSFFSFFF